MLWIWLRRLAIAVVVLLLWLSPLARALGFSGLLGWPLIAGLVVSGICTLALEVSGLLDGRRGFINFTIVMEFGSILVIGVLGGVLPQACEWLMMVAFSAVAVVALVKYSIAMLTAWHPLGLRP